MPRTVTIPSGPRHADGTMPGGWWHDDPDGEHLVCDLCPRSCRLKPGDRGFCFVRQNIASEMVLTTYGRSTGFCVDPIEKKPLNHFFPGSAVLSFGTAGCNLGCKFCQNWESSKSREVERASSSADPETIAVAAQELGCQSVAFTYNDPVIWAEYAIDTARACRALGIKTVAVTAGYITPEARRTFYSEMDAANVDLKAFTEDFYWHLTSSHLEPVLDTLRWLKHETNVWFELTNLVIPDENDSADELSRMCDWVLESLGDEVPIHFTAFHPDFRLLDHPKTPLAKLVEAYDLATTRGLKYVYVGNVHDPAHESTYCPNCSTLLIERNWHELRTYRLQGNRCGRCQHVIAGHFAAEPGDWGQRRLPVDISRFARPTPSPSIAPPSTSTPGGAPMSSAPVTQSPDSSDATEDRSSRALTIDQQQQILESVCDVVSAAVCGRPAPSMEAHLTTCAQRRVAGAFVTLKRGTHLRACCGFMGESLPLGHAVQQAALRTATQDLRLPPIVPSELPHLHVDVSLLYDFQPITQRGTARAQAVQVGLHGLTIRRGESGGLLLPIVAVEAGWDAPAFLRHVCRKAGLPPTAWEEDDAQLQTFTATLIEGPFAPHALKRLPIETPAPFLPGDLQRLAEHCRHNILSLLQGATPSYYLPNCPDANVQGVAVRAEFPETHLETSTGQLSFRPGMPLQSTLFQCAEVIVRAIRTHSLPVNALPSMQVDVAVLHDCAMHGTVASPQLAGIDTKRRAVLITERDRYAWTFDGHQPADQLVQSTAAHLQLLNAPAAGIYSLAADCSSHAFSMTNLPHPQPGPRTRPAAVAGTFYPDNPTELQAIVERCCATTGNARPAEWWPAVLVPHAGLRYSGHIAAEVFRRVTIPDRVLILAPKHTRQGVPWAVTPHETWTIPGGHVAADPDFAQRLAAAVSGLKLDAVAHRDEHSIEVQLPLLAHLAPHTAVIGIAIGDCDLAKCQQFARELAEFLRGEESRPLLVVSSDLNHYAQDAENRRLDRIALDALATRDPAHVFHTIRDQDISMCGVLPAVIALETLQQLGELSRHEELTYATSADAGGSAERVVGYAGVLWG